MSDSYNWIIEGIDGLDEQNIRHMNAFYALLKKWLRDKEYVSKLLTKEDYDTRVNFILSVKDGVIDCRDQYLNGNLNAYKWLKKYHVVKYADSAVLVHKQ